MLRLYFEDEDATQGGFVDAFSYTYRPLDADADIYVSEAEAIKLFFSNGKRRWAVGDYQANRKWKAYIEGKYIIEDVDIYSHSRSKLQLTLLVDE